MNGTEDNNTPRFPLGSAAATVQTLAQRDAERERDIWQRAFEQCLSVNAGRADAAQASAAQASAAVVAFRKFFETK